MMRAYNKKLKPLSDEKINDEAEHKDYKLFIQQYFEAHFALIYQGDRIPLNWLGFEVVAGKIIAYPKSAQQSFLIELVVKNAILTNTYPKQINTVNYQGSEHQGKVLFGSLTFDHSSKALAINKKTIPSQ